MKRIYKGWIPTVSGRLSFDVIGTGSYPHSPEYINLSSKELRYILCRQERVLLDNAIPVLREGSVRSFFGEIGRFHFICVATAKNNITIENADLSGYLFIYSDEVLREAIGEEFTKKTKYLNDYVKIKNELTLDQYFSEEYDYLINYLKADCHFYANFTLKRNGVTIIEIDEEFSGNANAPTIDAGDDYVYQSLGSQIFFFLKDIVHNHQHHDPTSDTVSDVYLVKCDEDEYRWRCEALRLLYRLVLTYKRNRREEVCNSALGLITYIKSFKNISVNDLNKNSYFENNDKKELMPVLDDQLLIQSINASQETMRNQIQNKIRKHDKHTNIMLALLTIVLSVVGALQITDLNYKLEDVAAIYHFLSWAIITKPEMCFVFLVVAWLYTADRTGVINFKIKTDIYRLLVTQDQYKAVVALRAFGLAVFIAIYIVALYLDKIIKFIH